MNAHLVLAILMPFLALSLQWILWLWISQLVRFLFFPTVFFSARPAGLKTGLDNGGDGLSWSLSQSQLIPISRPISTKRWPTLRRASL